MGNLCSADTSDVVESAQPDKIKEVKDDVSVKDKAPAADGAAAAEDTTKTKADDSEVKTVEAVPKETPKDAEKEAPVEEKKQDPTPELKSEPEPAEPEEEEEEEVEAGDEEISEDVVFWAMPISANSAVVRCFLNTCGISYHEKNAYGLTRTKAYIAKFPTNLAPSIEHKGKYVTECGAILKYLSRVYPKQASRFYNEKKLKEVTTIDWLLDHENTGLLAQLPKAVYPTLGFPLGPGDCAMLECTKQHTPMAIEAGTEYIEKALKEKYVEIFLKDTKFLMSDSPTIADFRFAPMINFMRVACKIPSRIDEYYEEMELLRGFKEGCQPVVDFASPKWVGN
jgi:glutathione S-transferase